MDRTRGARRTRGRRGGAATTTTTPNNGRPAPLGQTSQPPPAPSRRVAAAQREPEAQQQWQQQQRQRAPPRQTRTQARTLAQTAQVTTPVNTAASTAAADTNAQHVQPLETPGPSRQLHRRRGGLGATPREAAAPAAGDTEHPVPPPVHPQRATRFEIPVNPSDSETETELRIAAMTRARGVPQRFTNMISNDESEGLISEHYLGEGSVEQSEEEMDVAPLFDPVTIGLKEISNLGKFTASSHKPGNGVEELRSDDLKLYWQSDGPQPHMLTIYFVKRVGIRDIRFYVDYNEDESYTPTKIIFKSGTSENNLIQFATMNLENPVGWQQVPLAGAGGEPDGNTLVSYVLQMQTLENHQNGKDTHLRGFKIYAFDADAAHGSGQDRELTDGPAKWGNASRNNPDSQEESGDPLGDIVRSFAAARVDAGEVNPPMPDFMREPELR